MIIYPLKIFAEASKLRRTYIVLPDPSDAILLLILNTTTKRVTYNQTHETPALPSRFGVVRFESKVTTVPAVKFCKE